MDRIDDKDPGRFDEMLSRYMKGQMSADEEGTFIQLLKDNDILRDKAVATARLVRAMARIGDMDDKEAISAMKDMTLSEAEGIAAKACDATTGKPRISSFRRLILPFSVAASILLCVFGGYKYYGYRQVTTLGYEYLTYFPASEFSRGEKDDVGNRLVGICSDVETKRNLDAAISELKIMWTESRSDTYNDYTDHMPEIGWLLANAYLRNNDKAEALGVLVVLIGEYPDGSALGDKARELKRKIEEL